MSRENENSILISRIAEKCHDSMPSVRSKNLNIYEAVLLDRAAKQFKNEISKHFIVLCEIKSSIFAIFYLARPIWQIRFNPKTGSSNDTLIFESQDKKELKSKLKELMTKHKEGYRSIACQVSFDNGENFEPLLFFDKYEGEFTESYSNFVLVNKKKIVW